MVPRNLENYCRTFRFILSFGDSYFNMVALLDRVRELSRNGDQSSWWSASILAEAEYSVESAQ